ncbi:hypothetical protein H5410_006290 [Solanum commersonii]|uniref:PB1-like domain-containing protein n=1 Tax=Solanum commersonii TaxID=4109 RepID=A0A9J6A9G4_SOLCO|nr:hypothetical protein H5410_006290 [Solanum commersonii]
MDIIIVTRFHHGGKFVEDTSGGGLTYIGEGEVEYVGIDKDHFSLMELLFYTRDLGYVTVDLGDRDFLDLYVQHVVDEVEIIKDGVLTGYLCGPTVGEIINEDGVENSHNINVDEGLQQGAAQSENISVEVGVDEGLQQGATHSENIIVELGVDDASDLKGVETNWAISDDSQEFTIPDDDDSEIGSSQPPSSRQPRSCSQPPSSGQPVGSSQPPTWRPSQYVSSGQQSTSICDDTLIVRRVQQVGKGRERGRGKGRGRGGDDTSTVTKGQQTGRCRGREGASTSTRGNKRPKTVGFGIYTDDISGRQTLNPRSTCERVVTPAVFKCTTPTNIDIGYKPRGLKWKGKDVVTTPQLQRMSNSKGGGFANMPSRRGDEQYDRLMNNLSPFLLPKSVQQKHKTTNTITLRLLT